MTRYRILAALLALALIAVLSPLHAQTAAAQQSGGLTATLTVAPSTVAVGQQVVITYTVPPSPTATFTSGLTTSSIDFGDGQTIDGGGVGPGGETIRGTVVHAYTDPGTYTVTLTAQAPDGETGSAGATVTVSSQLQPPSVQIQGPTASVQTGASVSFSYSVTPASGAGIAAIGIDYGDGSTDMLTAPSGTVTHTYSSAGAYAVLLSAQDSNGQLGAASAVVQVGS